MQSITVNNISKQYQTSQIGGRSILQTILSNGTIRPETLAVLFDISFTVPARQILGIIGSNGCGKSTLLRIIAGILSSDTGSVTVHGRLVPLIHLDSGVKGRLTMRENIYLAGTLLGMGTKQITAQMQSIAEYAGLESFLDTKWYTFSDGMKQTVVFSIGIHAQPDILLLDEAFSAGDRAFRNKSMKTIQKLAKSGVTVIMVGHDLDSMIETCDRVLWIEKGVIHRDGLPEEVITEYRAKS